MSEQDTNEYFDESFDFGAEFEEKEDEKSAETARSVGAEEEENRRIYGQQIELLEAFQRQMQAVFGKKIELSFSTPFSPANNPSGNDLTPIVFLGKNITNVSIRKKFELFADGQAVEKVESVVTEYDGYLRIIHTQANKGNETKHILSVENMQIQDDLYAEPEGTVKNAMFETARAALFLAREASLAGEKKVDFGRTTDPVYRLALEVACKLEGLDCTAETPVDLQKLPKTFYGDKFADELVGTIAKVRAEIFSAPSLTDKPEIKHEEQQPKAA